MWSIDKGLLVSSYTIGLPVSSRVDLAKEANFLNAILLKA